MIKQFINKVLKIRLVGPEKQIKISFTSFLAFSLLYFFCNNLFLPEGLLYTSILSPFFIYWLMQSGKMKQMIIWSILLIIPIPFHIIFGIDLKSYIISSLLVFSAWIFLFTSINVLKATRQYHTEMMEFILSVNILLVILIWILLQFDLGNKTFWFYARITQGVYVFPRLKLMGYEPSHYSMLVAPVYIFFIVRILIFRSVKNWYYLPALGIPLMLSLSFGVIGCLGIALTVSLALYYARLPSTTKQMLIFSILIIVSGFVILSFLWPENPVFIRIENILTNNDSSAKGRLSQSFIYAKEILEYSNYCFGAGPGQIKLIASELFSNPNSFHEMIGSAFRIPNSIAETLATYGIYGLLIKITAELYFFIRLKIYNNLFSLCLFLFIFIYQFTGSFYINIAEIGTWAMVFNLRPVEFDKESFKTATQRIS